jgi:hypothetical protein
MKVYLEDTCVDGKILLNLNGVKMYQRNSMIQLAQENIQ